MQVPVARYHPARASVEAQRTPHPYPLSLKERGGLCCGALFLAQMLPRAILLPLREKVGFREAEGRMRGALSFPSKSRRGMKLGVRPFPSRENGHSYCEPFGFQGNPYGRKA